MHKTLYLFLINLLFISTSLFSKEPIGVGQWKNINTYNQVVDMDYYGQKFYCATESAFFIYHKEENYIETFSKAKGMNDIAMTAIAYDSHSKITVLAYKNNNIDLWDGYKFRNISDIRLANISGDKSINHITTDKGIAYISTGIGLILLDIKAEKIIKTIHFYENQSLIPIHQSLIEGNRVYITNTNGIFSSSLQNNNMENAASWEKHSSIEANYIISNENTIYFSSADKVYNLSENIIYQAPENIQLLDGNKEAIWVSWKGSGEDFGTYKINNSGTILDSIPARQPSRIISLADQSTWYSDYSNYTHKSYYGFYGKNSLGEITNYTPAGPGAQMAFDLDVQNGNIYIAHGGFESQNFARTNNRRNISTYIDGKWHHYHWLSNENYIEDFIRIAKHPNKKTFYAGSYSAGLMIFHDTYDYELLDGNILPPYASSFPESVVGGLAFDKDNNLWISTSYSTNELNVLKDKDGEILKMKRVETNTGGSLPHSAMDIIIDDYNQKWFTTYSNNAGVVVYNDNGTLEDIYDDKYTILKSGEGRGNLPSGNTRSIAKDLQGAIWIGTDNGIGIVYCPGDVIDGNCEATLKKVTNKEDGFVGHIFENQLIKAIAVDAANRKWIGTPNGVWLISPDGEDEIHHFNVDNSPLPHNNIHRIKIDENSGEVYFATEGGIAIFKADAKIAQKDLEHNLHVYPNPVPPNFQGIITIDNLTENADVRITDIYNNLVYKTVSKGGRATWNGYDYTGAKAQSGVYIIYVISKNGELKGNGRFIIHR